MLRKTFKKKKINNNNDINVYLNQSYKIRPNKEALIITITYGIFGLLWIALSDKVLYLMISDIDAYRNIQTYKGVFYVVITMVLIYFLVLRRSTLFESAIMKIIESYENLQSTYEELVATEEELIYQKDFTANIIRCAPVVIATWDDEGRIKSLNPFGLRLFKYTENEILNKKWLELLIPTENKHLMKSVMGQIKNNKKLKNHESQFITKDKVKIEMLWNSSILR